MEQMSAHAEPMIKAAWSNPPLLKGFAYPSPDAYRARDQRKLLSLRMAINASGEPGGSGCNRSRSEGPPREASLDFLKDSIRQAKELGIRSVMVTGSEPVLHSKFRGLIQYIASRDLTPVVDTGLEVMDKTLADFIFRRHVSVLARLDPSPQFPRPWGEPEIRNALQPLLDAGFGQNRNGRTLRLGLALDSEELTLAEIETAWRFCRGQNIHPHLEWMQLQAGTNASAGEEAHRLSLDLLRIDRESYGWDWLPFGPLAGGGCLQHLCSLYITVDGDVRPCAATPLDNHPALRAGGEYPHNLKRRTLREVYDSDLFSYIRNIDAFLEGKCRRCLHLDQCLGCRGSAYQAGVSRGLDPYASLRQESPQCFKT